MVDPSRPKARKGKASRKGLPIVRLRVGEDGDDSPPLQAFAAA